jgi:transcriptional regulator GlxA family with amidase domain
VASNASSVQDSAMHRVAIVALDGVVPFDLATPCEVFGRVRLPGGRPGYQVRVCGIAKEIDAGTFRLRARHGIEELARADTIILPGVDDLSAAVPERLVRAVRKAAARGTRVASICSGAFVLAATGLLDGRRATTHWLASGELTRRYPKVRVDPEVLYVDEGQVLTSAGAAAAFDLCLHMVRRDYGLPSRPRPLVCRSCRSNARAANRSSSCTLHRVPMDRRWRRSWSGSRSTSMTRSRSLTLRSGRR